MEERNVWTIFDESKENKDIIIVPFIYSGDAVQCSKSTGGVYTLPLAARSPRHQLDLELGSVLTVSTHFWVRPLHRGISFVVSYYFASPPSLVATSSG
jgi:hypothetical protein